MIGGLARRPPAAGNEERAIVENRGNAIIATNSRLPQVSSSVGDALGLHVAHLQRGARPSTAERSRLAAQTECHRSQKSAE
jgi:hypothetical protein